MNTRVALEIGGCAIVVLLLFATLPSIKEYIKPPTKVEKIYVEVPVPAPRWVEYEWCQTSTNNSKICKIKGE